MTMFPCIRQMLPTVGHTVRLNPDPFLAGETITCWPPWDIDSCLVLAPDPSAMKTQSWNNLIKMIGQKNWGKGYATTGRAQRRNFHENLRRPAPSTIKMEYRSFDGTVTMLLRVVAPQTQWWSMDFEKTPNPNLFLASLSESRGRDSF